MKLFWSINVFGGGSNQVSAQYKSEVFFPMSQLCRSIKSSVIPSSQFFAWYQVAQHPAITLQYVSDCIALHYGIR